MRRRGRGAAARSQFALWLDAVWCRHPDWLARRGPLGPAPDVHGLVLLWRDWPPHAEHRLRWMP